MTDNRDMSAIGSVGSGSGIAQYLQSLAGTGPLPAAAAAAPVAKGKHHQSSAFDKLLQAVTHALQSTGSNSSDPNKTITDALTKIFQNHSIPTTPGADADTETDGQSTGAIPATFAQTLKSFGVTPQQFQADLAAALKTAQETGNADPTSAFKSFPTGSIVDTFG